MKSMVQCTILPKLSWRHKAPCHGQDSAWFEYIVSSWLQNIDTSVSHRLLLFPGVSHSRQYKMKAGLVFDDATRCNTDSDPRRPFTKVAPPIANEWGSHDRRFQIQGSGPVRYLPEHPPARPNSRKIGPRSLP